MSALDIREARVRCVRALILLQSLDYAARPGDVRAVRSGLAQELQTIREILEALHGGVTPEETVQAVTAQLRATWPEVLIELYRNGHSGLPVTIGDLNDELTAVENAAAWKVLVDSGLVTAAEPARDYALWAVTCTGQRLAQVLLGETVTECEHAEGDQLSVDDA